MTTVRVFLLATALAVLGLMVGCASRETRVGVGVGVRAPVDTPILVSVGHGVWVVEDYTRPVFYYEGDYYMFWDDAWYRSSRFDAGYVQVSTVPRILRTVKRPREYIGYRGPSNAERRAIERRRPRAMRTPRGPR
jgi:hypothetical protein